MPSRLVPSAVKTLIQRRAARLPAATRSAMGDAALLGRSFSLRDLQAIRVQLGEERPSRLGDLADAMSPAVSAGLLLEHGEDSPADYTFTHEQVREFASAALSHARRRQSHAAIVDLLAGEGDRHRRALRCWPSTPSPPVTASVPPLLDRRRPGGAPVERSGGGARVIEQALPIVSSRQDRRDLLDRRDDAYAMVRRPGNRLEGLAELAALAEAMRDSHFELEVMIRRACALRLPASRTWPPTLRGASAAACVRER